MKTEIKKITDVEFDLEIVAEAADLADEINAAVNKQKAQTNMKGFRAGKVPTSLVRRVYGKALAYGVAEERVQKAFQETVLEGDDYEVLGQPTITDLEYE
ncbi:MAG TPA: trigger factor, partial [Bacteroidetes bacterium]|nr:trigger factor [Bacteroidota bacterium]